MTSLPSVAVDLRALVRSQAGIAVYTRELLTALAEAERWRLVGMSHRPLPDGAWMRQARIGFEAQPSPLGVLWQQWTLPRRLRRGDFDLFWSPLQTLPLASPVPSVVTVHDLTPVLLPETHRFKVRLSQLPFLGRSLDLARLVVVGSRSTARDLVHFFPQVRDRMRRVPYGVGAEFRPASAEAVAAVREELGAPDGYLLYAGTLEPRKNVGLLLDAWESLRRDEAAPPLVLVGPAGWKSRQLLQRVDRLRPLGLLTTGLVPRARLVELMQSAEVFVYPSLYEGFGLPPLEAMACGVPTVVSRVASLPEVVGEAGLLVDPTDPAALAVTLQELIADRPRRQAMRERGLERAAAFSWKRSAELMHEVFEEALDG